jgi:glucose/arabinose dehydrogenase
MDLDEGPVNRMSRYTLNSDLKSIDEDSELVMFETRRLNTQTHNSGYIAFGKDGNLYVTVGEAGTKKAKSTDGTPYPMAFDVTLGCVLRLTDDGGIPPDNPFSPENDKNSVRCNKDGESGNHKKRCQEVYACGLRNPFRFAVDPNADGTRFFINDVGDATWERVLEGGDGHAGAQYGYPEREGPCVKTTDKDNFDCEPQDWLDYPVHWYKVSTARPAMKLILFSIVRCCFSYYTSLFLTIIHLSSCIFHPA